MLFATTTYGNEGIKEEPGKKVFVADNPADFASFVANLVQDEGLRDSVESAGRRYVGNNFSENSLVATIEGTNREISPIKPI